MSVATDFVATQTKPLSAIVKLKLGCFPRLKKAGWDLVAHLREQNVSEGQLADRTLRRRDLQGLASNALTEIDSCAQSAQP